VNLYVPDKYHIPNRCHRSANDKYDGMADEHKTTNYHQNKANGYYRFQLFTIHFHLISPFFFVKLKNPIYMIH